MPARSNGLLGSAATSETVGLATWSRPFAHTRLVVVRAARIKAPIDCKPVADTRSDEDQQKTNTDDTDDEADHESGLASGVAGSASGVRQRSSAQLLFGRPNPPKAVIPRSLATRGLAGHQSPKPP